MINLMKLSLSWLLLLSFIHPVIDEENHMMMNIYIDQIEYTDILTDNAYESEVTVQPEQAITIQSEKPFSYIYIEFNNEPSPYSISYGEEASQNINKHYLHNYIELKSPITSCDIHLTNTERIANIYIFDNNDNSIQKWTEPEEDVDILVFATHADDEILFLGGVLATYAGEKNLNVQVVYLCEFYSTNEIREHEKLDGLWTVGVKNYPVTGPFPDVYLETLDQAMEVYDYPTMLSFITENIRKYKPKIVVTQDINGEYGHGAHKILVKAVCESVENSMNDDFYPDSGKLYGTYDVPKTYLHLYWENQIRLDLRKPLEAFNGRNAIEVASEAFLKHVTQQWTGFFVTDDPNEVMYDASLFGLYRTTVGEDINKDDILDNLSFEEEIEEEIIEEEIELTPTPSSTEEIKNEEIVIEEKKEESFPINKVLLSFAIICIILLLILFPKKK